MAGKAAPVQSVAEAFRRAYGGPQDLDEERPLEQLVLLILSDRTEIRKARLAMKRLQADYVDWNEVRVTSAWEIRSRLSPLGSRKVEEKANQLKELLSTVYNRFNKMNLDFLSGEGGDADDSRKRERFLAYLQERSPALAAMMAVYRSKKNDPSVSAGVARVMQRLGWIDGKNATVGAARQALVTLIPEEERISIQWGLHQVMDEFCHARNPDCPQCPAVRACPSGKQAKGAKKKAKKTAAKKKTKSKAKVTKKSTKAGKAPAKKATRPSSKKPTKAAAKKATKGATRTGRATKAKA